MKIGVRKIADNNHVKIIYVLLDGVGDLPHPDLAGKTPLEAATTKNMDVLEKKWYYGSGYISWKGYSTRIRHCCL